MSTSLLYHGFGIRGYQYLNTQYKGGEVLFEIEQGKHDLRCSHCGDQNVIRRGTVKRRFRSVPIGTKAVWVILAIQRVWCAACQLIRQVEVDFADNRRSYTKAFERFVLDLSRHTTIEDVARHLGIGWDMVKDIQKRNLNRRFAKPSLKNLSHIAIDEISVRKGHKYLTIVLNLTTGVVVFVGDGKGADALSPFWERLHRRKNKIKAVAIDMSPAYISAVMDNLPKATIVFDHFHVIKLYNEKMDDLRRQVYKNATDALEKKAIKGTRWILLKNPENLDADKNEPKRLQEALREFWYQPNKEAATRCLQDWVNQANQSKIPILMKFARTLLAHRSGILAYYDFPITSGPLEGLNNKIKTMKRQAYGFRDMEFFKLKIMALHQTKYALVG
jgi:transposase